MYQLLDFTPGGMDGFPGSLAPELYWLLQVIAPPNVLQFVEDVFGAS